MKSSFSWKLKGRLVLLVTREWRYIKDKSCVECLLYLTSNKIALILNEDREPCERFWIGNIPCNRDYRQLSWIITDLTNQDNFWNYSTAYRFIYRDRKTLVFDKRTIDLWGGGAIDICRLDADGFESKTVKNAMSSR